MKIFKKNRKGFTLIELVVVIAIIAILALILIPTISGYIKSAETSRSEANARNIYTAAILVLETEEIDPSDEAAFIEAVQKYAKFKEEDGVSLAYEGETLTVTYKDVTFDGEDFNPKPEN